MERKVKNTYNNYNFHYSRYNSTSIKQNNNNINELNKRKKNEIKNIKNDNINKAHKFINEINNDIPKSKYNKYANGTNLNINENIINDFEDNNLINPEQEQINKLKLENEKLKKDMEKKNKLIIELRDICNEQKTTMAEIMSKIENLKKIIPESALKKSKERQKEKDKLEEQMAIAAVEEQIIKELCPNNSNQAAMDKIFNDNNSKENNYKIKDKINKMPQIYYEKNKFDNSECFICIDEFKENELLKQLNCGHVFHKECLSQWLINMNNCPICNKIC